METALTNPWYWVIAGVILIGLEIVVPGVFLLWIGLGALLSALLIVLFPDLPSGWYFLFFAVALLSSGSLGFWIQRRGKQKAAGLPVLNQEMDGMLHKEYIAAVDFSVGRGRIRVGDTTYTALGPDSIKAGDIVLAYERQGIQFKVRPLSTTGQDEDPPPLPPEVLEKP